MKKIIKKFVSIMLFVSMLLSISACGDNGKLQVQLDALQVKIEAQGEKISALEEENGVLKDKINDLELRADSPYGVFCSLKTAYNYDWLTYDQLKSIAYYQNGGRNLNEDIMSENYTPIAKDPEMLEEDTARKIRETVAYGHRNNGEHSIPSAKESDVTIEEYYGCYNGLYVLMLTDAFTGYDAAEWEINIGGVNFLYSNGNRITLYIENSDLRSLLVDDMANVQLGNIVTQEASSTQEDSWNEIVQTQSELQVILGNHASSMSAKQRALFAKYDEAYFAENALIVCSFFCGNSGNTITHVGALKIWEAKLNIKITYREGILTATSNILTVIEVKKSEIEGVHTLTVSVDNGIITNE